MSGIEPSELWAVAGLTVGFYLFLFVLLRLAGRRTLAQISAFDFLVTVAIGSMLANTALAPATGFARGVVGVSALVSAQLLVAYIRRRFPRTQKVLDFAPRVVARDGDVETSDAIWGPQLTRNEIMSMLRQEGVFDLKEIQVVILEPGGGISIVRGSSKLEA